MDFSEKAGRAISKANGRRIMAALTALHDGVSAIEEMLSEYGIGEEAEPEGEEPEGAEESETAKQGAGPDAPPTPTEAERLKLLLEIEMEQ